MFPNLSKAPPGAGTIFAPTTPLIDPADISIGRYLADATLKRLYCVVDLRYVKRDGKRVRLAMLEDAVTEEIMPWEFGRLAAFRRVEYVRPAEGEILAGT